jgi:hypothetical protein
MKNQCCVKEHSVKFFVRFFYTVRLHSLTESLWGPLSLNKKSLDTSYDFCNYNLLPFLCDTIYVQLINVVSLGTILELILRNFHFLWQVLCLYVCPLRSERGLTQ